MLMRGNDYRDASVNSAYDQNINLIDCQDVRSDQIVFVKITKVDIVTAQLNLNWSWSLT